MSEVLKKLGPVVHVRCFHCGVTNAHPIGECSPSQYACNHVLSWDPLREDLICAGCGLSVSGQVLAAAGFVSRKSNSQRANQLADEAQRLRDENREVLAESATLRRALERAKR